MAKKAAKNNADGELTVEELEAIEAERAKNKKKKDENPDAPPVTEPSQPPTVPENPGNLPTDQPTDNNDTVIITGDPEDPTVIVVPAEPTDPIASPESDVENKIIEGGTDGDLSRSNA